METTLFLAKIVGLVLLLRAISILIDRKHFLEMLGRIEEESKTVAFSIFSIRSIIWLEATEQT